MLWLNKTDDPGLGTLKPLGYKPAVRIKSVDLLALLKQLDEHSLVLNVLRPLLAESEREVREHVVEWVETIRQAPNLDHQTEERLLIILSQLIEQKFRTLSYKELAQMIRLTPLHETDSFQEGFKEEHIKTLMPHFQAKYLLSTKQYEALQNDLQQLPLDDVRALYVQSLHMDMLEQLRNWVIERLPVEST